MGPTTDPRHNSGSSCEASEVCDLLREAQRFDTGLGGTRAWNGDFLGRGIGGSKLHACHAVPELKIVARWFVLMSLSLFTRLCFSTTT